MDRFSNIEETVDTDTPQNERQSALECMPTPASLSPKKKKTPEDVILEPVSSLHILRMQGRETNLPDAPKEKTEVPVIPDMKKAEEDYNSVDYQIIAFNLWKNKAKEFF